MQRNGTCGTLPGRVRRSSWPKAWRMLPAGLEWEAVTRQLRPRAPAHLELSTAAGARSHHEARLDPPGSARGQRPLLAVRGIPAGRPALAREAPGRPDALRLVRHDAGGRD